MLYTVPSCRDCGVLLYMRSSGLWAHANTIGEAATHTPSPAGDDLFSRHLVSPEEMHVTATMALHAQLPVHAHHDLTESGHIGPVPDWTLEVEREANNAPREDLTSRRRVARSYATEGPEFTFEVSLEAPTDADGAAEMERFRDNPQELLDIVYLSLFGEFAPKGGEQ